MVFILIGPYTEKSDSARVMDLIVYPASYHSLIHVCTLIRDMIHITIRITLCVHYYTYDDCILAYAHRFI